MKLIKFVILFFLSFAIITCTEKVQIININKDIRLKELADNIWIHTSDINTPKWGTVSANGLVVLSGKDLVIIDTPWNDDQTQLLVQWFEKHYEINDIKVIVSHYHEDNLGGLHWIHKNRIASYSIKRTQEICKEKGLPIPQNTIPDTYILNFSKTPIEVIFPGEGHTVDCVCVYLPQEKILFGGCSIKALDNVTLGNTEDANILEWPHTLRNIKSKFPDAEVVIPGHGLESTVALIDHTLSLFK